MDTTIVLAQALGIIFAVTGISMLSNKKSVANAVEELVHDSGALWYGGFAALVMGAFIVAVHNTWGSGLQIVVSLMGWLAILKGASIMFFPKTMVSWYKGAARSSMLTIAGYVVLVLGLILLYLGLA